MKYLGAWIYQITILARPGVGYWLFICQRRCALGHCTPLNEATFDLPQPSAISEYSSSFRIVCLRCWFVRLAATGLRTSAAYYRFRLTSTRSYTSGLKAIFLFRFSSEKHTALLTTLHSGPRGVRRPPSNPLYHFSSIGRSWTGQPVTKVIECIFQDAGVLVSQSPAT
jgi:hypothetical protein